MDYFFDGVPPLGQVPFEADLLDPDSQQPDQTGQTPTWYVHEPRKDCANCHRKRRTGGFSAQTYLTAPVPELCHNCHDASMIELIPAHLPEQTSACTDCHNPHSGSTKALLKETSTEARSTKEKPMNEPSSRGPAANAEKYDRLRERQKETAELYYRSLKCYREGELTRARDGFVKVLKSGLIPAPMADSLRAHIADMTIN